MVAMAMLTSPRLYTLCLHTTEKAIALLLPHIIIPPNISFSLSHLLLLSLLLLLFIKHPQLYRGLTQTYDM